MRSTLERTSNLEDGLARDEAHPTQRRLRVVVGCFGVHPLRGSEPATAWQHVSRLARYHDITAITTSGVHGELRQEIEEYRRTVGLPDGLKIEYVDPSPIAKFLDCNHTSIRRSFFYIGNADWQRAAYRRALELHQQQPFDIAHHLTITGFREPGYLWKLGVPFFWGPVTGAANVPWRYLPMMGAKDTIAYGLRNIANFVQQRLAIRPRQAAKAAHTIWAVGPENQELIGDRWGYPCTHMFEVGTVLREDVKVREFAPGQKLQLVTSGYHVGRKAVNLVLQALAKLGQSFPYEMTIIGTGPAVPKWQALGEQLGLGDRVRWTGKLTHRQALEEMARAHVFLFPSVKEGLPNVVAEALSFGVPVICHNICGMAQFVTDESGIRIPIGSPRTSIERFAEAIKRMATTPQEVSRLSAGAIERSRELTWDENARRMSEAFSAAVRSNA